MQQWAAVARTQSTGESDGMWYTEAVKLATWISASAHAMKFFKRSEELIAEVRMFHNGSGMVAVNRMASSTGCWL